MSKKVIKIGLSVKDINRAIAELEQYKQELVRKTELLRTRVAERIADEARSGFSSALLDDLLPKSGASRSPDVNVSIDNRENVTVVIADGEDAVWCEFGAGVYHNGTPGASPHPKGAELGFTIGGYGKGNGKKAVWGYYDEGELKLTHGTPASMPMYKAAKSVCDHIDEIAREVFG